MSDGAAAPPRFARRRLWLVYTILTIVGALIVLAIYVNTYDDYDVSDRLRSAGLITRRVMNALSFPIGSILNAVVGQPLENAFQCGEATEPCAVFVDWNLRFAALIMQIGLLRWWIARRL